MSDTRSSEELHAQRAIGLRGTYDGVDPPRDFTRLHETDNENEWKVSSSPSSRLLIYVQMRARVARAGVALRAILRDSA